jgi:RimJ/RimL family protein N-acetyltransferase
MAAIEAEITPAVRLPAQVRTDRLLLRRLAPADLPVLVREIGRWEVARWLINVPHPYGEADAAHWLATAAAWAKAGIGLHYVAVPGDGAEMIGGIGLKIAERAEAELGYWLAPSAWGRGFATEMARAVIDAGFQTLNIAAVIAGTDPDNAASHRVLLKAGLTLTHIDPMHTRGLRGPPAPARRYRLTRADWEARHDT